MKALAILNDMKLKYNSHYIEGSDQVIKLDEAIDELEQVLKEKDLLEEYVQFARLHIFDLDGNFIAKYASQSEASRQTNISQGNIGQVLTGNRIQSGGYKWQYQMNLEN